MTCHCAVVAYVAVHPLLSGAVVVLEPCPYTHIQVLIVASAAEALHSSYTLHAAVAQI